MYKSFTTQIVVAVLLVLGIVFFVRGGAKPDDEIEAVLGASSSAEENLEIKQDIAMEQETVEVVVKTSQGTFVLELWKDKAPKTVENFVTLAQNGFYNGTRFHRVIEGFMVQGGDPLSKDTAQMNRWGTGGPGYQFEDEIHSENKNMIGTISMANAGPNTNGSQFFINVADNNFLDTKHTVFGRVIEGYDSIETISLVDTVSGVDRPVEEVVIESVEIK